MTTSDVCNGDKKRNKNGMRSSEKVSVTDIEFAPSPAERYKRVLQRYMPPEDDSYIDYCRPCELLPFTTKAFYTANSFM